MGSNPANHATAEAVVQEVVKAERFEVATSSDTVPVLVVPNES